MVKQEFVQAPGHQKDDQLGASTETRQNVVVVFTDGRIGYQRRVQQAAEELGGAGTKFVFVVLKSITSRVSTNIKEL